MLWLRLFILSGVISPLNSSSILGTYQHGEFIFQCHIFLPFHTVHVVLEARKLKWFSVPFSSGQCFVRTLPHDPSVFGGPTGHGFIELDKSVVHVIRLVQFSSVSQSCLTVCNPMSCTTPGLPVQYQLPEFTQTHVY